MANTVFGYVETSGSNVATFDASSIVDIERTFIGPAATLWSFIRYMVRRPHPVARYAYPTSIRVSPAVGESTRSVPPRDPAAAVIAYDVAQVTIRYGMTASQVAYWPEGMDVPRRRKGTWLELKIDAGGEFLTIENATWDGSQDDPFSPLPPGESPVRRLYVAQQQIAITWHGVTLVPQKRFEDLLGTVNSTAFLGKPAQTLLFESYAPQMEVALDPDFPVKWAITCNFLYRGVKSGDKTYGWNHELKPQSGWTEVYVKTDSGWALRYTPKDFTNIFL